MPTLEERLHEWRQLGDQYADAQAESDSLEEFKKVKLAELMAEAECAGHKTIAAQEREAYRHPEYREFLLGLKEARRLAKKLEWQLRNAHKGSDLWQTVQANERAERRAYGA
jgi:hypothetical protein